MRTSSLSSAWVIGIVVMVTGLATAPRAIAQDRKPFEFSAGYQLIGIQGDVDETLGKGWYADLSGNLSRFMAAVFEVGGNYKTFRATETDQGMTLSAEADLRIHEFMGGIRIQAAPRPVTPFAQFLVGGTHSSLKASASLNGSSFEVSDSSTDLVTQIGGGVTFRLTNRIGVRAATDYIRIFNEEAGLNGFRFAAGAVFPF
jgi:hypothetical protein